MIEEWKPVIGYEGYYEVSNFGRVRSIGKHDRAGIFRKGRIRRLKKSRTGYWEITLSKDTELRTLKVHRLVANAFIPNPQCLPCVNHKDENKLNNMADNLEWVTQFENVHYGTALTRHKKTLSNQGIAKIQKGVLQYSLDNDLIAEYKSLTEAEKATKIDKSHISKCCRGKLKKTGGFVWKYKDE